MPLFDPDFFSPSYQIRHNAIFLIGRHCPGLSFPGLSAKRALWTVRSHMGLWTKINIQAVAKVVQNSSLVKVKLNLV